MTERKCGCIVVNHQLVEENMNLVYFVVNQYYPNFRCDQDIVQSGMLGLCKAAATWDESKSKFSTYATKCIRNEINLEFQRRNKHRGLLSLDYEVNTDDGGKTTFGDLQIGDEDVAYVDNDRFCELLTEDEKTVLTIDSMGFSPDEIAESCGWSVQKVWKILRVIQIKWRNFNRDSN